MVDKTADQFPDAESQDIFVAGTNVSGVSVTQRFNLSSLSHASTGVFTGGVITFATVSTIDVAELTGVVNDLTDTFPNQSHPINLIAYTYNATVAVDGTFLLLIDKLGVTSQELLDASDPTVRRRDFLLLGAFTVSGGAIVSVTNAKLSPLEPAQQLFDLLAGLGTIRFKDLAFSIIAGGTYSVNSGILASIGAGASNGGRAQNQIDIPAESPQSFIYVLGKTNTFLPGLETQIQSDIFDDGNVTPDAIPGSGSQATIQYIFKLPSDDNVNYIVIGQEVYSTMDDAEAAASSDQANLVVPSILAENAILLDRIVMQKTITDWEDMTEFTTLGGSIFGSTVQGGSAIGGGGGDFFGPASSQANELLTFSDGMGKIGLAASDVSILAGVIERLTNGEDLWLKVDATNENIFIGRNNDATGVPNLSNTSLLVTANGTNSIAMVTTGNNSQALSFTKNGTFRAQLNNNRDRNSLGLENATGEYIEIRPDKSVVYRSATDAKFGISSSNPTLEFQQANGTVEARISYNAAIANSLLITKVSSNSSIELATEEVNVAANTTINLDAPNVKQNGVPINTVKAFAANTASNTTSTTLTGTNQYARCNFGASMAAEVTSNGDWVFSASRFQNVGPDFKGVATFICDIAHSDSVELLYDLRVSINNEAGLVGIWRQQYVPVGKSGHVTVEAYVEVATNDYVQLNIKQPLGTVNFNPVMQRTSFKIT